MTSDGYMALPALLTHMKQKPSEQEVRSVVSCDAKVHTIAFMSTYGLAKASSVQCDAVQDRTTLVAVHE